MKLLLKSSVLLVLLIVCYSNYRIFKSSQYQSYVMFDYNNASWFVPIDIVKSNSGKFPNTTITTLPIKFLQARYFENIDSIEIAKKFYFEAMRKDINPYLKAAEAEIADLYFNQKEYDSAYYYAKQAFDALPNANVHRTIYFKTLKHRKDTVELENAFNKIKWVENSSHWVDYFYSRFALVGAGDNQINNLLKEYRQKFNIQDDIGTDILEKFMLKGENQIIASVDVSLEAEKLFKEKKYLDAAELFVIASQIEDSEYTFFENAAISYNMANEFKEANYYFDKVIYELNPKNGKSEFYKGLMLIKLDSVSKGCSYLSKAVKFEFSGSGSKDVYNNFCL